MQNLIPFIVIFLLDSINFRTSDIVETKMNNQRPRIIHNQKTKLSEVLIINPSEKDVAIFEKDVKQIMYTPIFEPSKNKINHHKKEVNKINE